jgi:hypothetical protein
MQLSRLYFKGTVLSVHNSLLPPIPASDSTFVVSIDTVFAPVPPALGDVRGQPVMVISQNPANLMAGERFFLFVNGRLYGHNMAVLEVCRTEVTADSAEVLQDIANAGKKLEDQLLKERLTAAEKIVVAKVLDISPYRGRTPQVVIGSEHNPDWWTADIQVISTEKGVHEPTLEVLFAHSRDVAWAVAPKLAPGPDSMILILDQAMIPEYNVSELSVQDPLDVQSTSELGHIRALLDEIHRRRGVR